VGIRHVFLCVDIEYPKPSNRAPVNGLLNNYINETL